MVKHRVTAQKSAAKWKKTVSKFADFFFDSVIIQLAILSIAVLSCIYYIVGTYSSSIESTGMDVFFFAVFLFDYIMCIIAAHRKLAYILSPMGLADLVSMVPFLGIFVPSSTTQGLEQWPHSWIGFLRFFRLFKIFQILRLREALTPSAQPHDATLALHMTEVSYQIAKLVISILVFLLVAAGSIFAVQSFNADAYNNFTQPGPLSWSDCLYFAIVSVTTVGYGDITPNSRVAKAVTVLVILFGFAIIPAQVGALVSTILSRHGYLGWLKLPPSTQHVCVCGIVDYELIYRLTTELFHPTHAPAVIGANIVVVILSPTPPSGPVQILLRMSQFRARVQYFMGNAKSFIDLSRVKAEDALAIYVVSDVNVRSLRAEEDSVFLSAVSISRYLDSKLWCRLERAVRKQQPGLHQLLKQTPGTNTSDSQQFQELNVGVSLSIDPVLCERPRTMVKLTSSARNRPVLAQSGIDVVLPLQEFRYTLIAYGAVFPGFLSLFLNLNRSRGNPKQTRQNWRQPELFYEGTRFCLHQMTTNTDDECHPSLRSMAYTEAVLSLYSRSKGQLLLVAVKYRGRVIINPSASYPRRSDNHDRASNHRGVGGIDSTHSASYTQYTCCPDETDTAEKHIIIGECDAVFVIAPSWEFAWEMMTEEREVEEEKEERGEATDDIKRRNAVRRSNSVLQQPGESAGTGNSSGPGRRAGNRPSSGSSVNLRGRNGEVVDIEMTILGGRNYDLSNRSGSGSGSDNGNSDRETVARGVRESTPFILRRSRSALRPIVSAPSHSRVPPSTQLPTVSASPPPSALTSPPTQAQRKAQQSQGQEHRQASVESASRSAFHPITRTEDIAGSHLLPQQELLMDDSQSHSSSSPNIITDAGASAGASAGAGAIVDDTAYYADAGVNDEDRVLQRDIRMSAGPVVVDDTGRKSENESESSGVGGSGGGIGGSGGRGDENTTPGGVIKVHRLDSYVASIVRSSSAPAREMTLPLSTTAGTKHRAERGAGLKRPLATIDETQQHTQPVHRAHIHHIRRSGALSDHGQGQGQRQDRGHRLDSSHAHGHEHDRDLKSDYSSNDKAGHRSSHGHAPLSSTFRDHVVLIITSSGHPQDVPPSALMLPVVFFIKAVRAHSLDPIVVLCERAEELTPLAAEISAVNPAILTNVHILAGVARNTDHLLNCGVEHAKVVAIVRPPMAAEAAQESEEISKAVMVNADRHTIITSLNLHTLLLTRTREYHRVGTNRSSSNSVNAGVRDVFTVCEVVHESNIVFLREHRQVNNMLTIPIASVDGVPRSLHLQAGPGATQICSMPIVSSGTESSSDYYDWPLLAAGCILSHTLLDALMVQTIFNPDVLAFWEAVIGTGSGATSGSSNGNSTDNRATAGDVNGNGSGRGSTRSAQVVNGRSSRYSVPSRDQLTPIGREYDTPLAEGVRDQQGRGSVVGSPIFGHVSSPPPPGSDTGTGAGAATVPVTITLSRSSSTLSALGPMKSKMSVSGILFPERGSSRKQSPGTRTRKADIPTETSKEGSARRSSSVGLTSPVPRSARGHRRSASTDSGLKTTNSAVTSDPRPAPINTRGARSSQIPSDVNEIERPMKERRPVSSQVYSGGHHFEENKGYDECKSDEYKDDDKDDEEKEEAEDGDDDDIPYATATSSYPPGASSSSSYSASSSSLASPFDKVDVPEAFIGQSFGVLFQRFYEEKGVIALAIYRHRREDIRNNYSRSSRNNSSSNNRNNNSALLPDNNNGNQEEEEDNTLEESYPLDNNTYEHVSTSSQLPYVITAPAMDTIMMSTDEIFIFRGTIF